MERKISQRQVWTAVLRVDMYILKEEGSQNKHEWKNLRRASVRAETRTYGTDSPCTIHHVIAPSSKKDRSMTDFEHTWFHTHGSHRKMFTRTLDTPNPWCGWRFSPLPEGNQSNGWCTKSMALNKGNCKSGGRLCNGVMDGARDFYLLGESVP